MSDIKVSIIIPIYNVEKYLRQCLDSAINQTLKEIEIICVNDGSTDSCPQILEEYAQKDNRIKVINKTNSGYGHSMNVGLEAATGEYCGILESDDFCMLDMYEELYKAAKKFDADAVKSDYFHCTTPNDEIILSIQQLTRRNKYYNRPLAPNKEKDVYTFAMFNWTGIYRTTFLREKNIKHNETPGASYQDTGFYFQVFSQTDKLVFIPKPFYCYRIDRPECSTYDKTKVYTMSEEFKFVRKFISEHKEFENEILPHYYRRLFRAHESTYRRIDPKLHEEYVKLIRKDMLEARDTHFLDTGILSERERINISLILKSEKDYIKVNCKSKLKSYIYVASILLKQKGIKGLKSFIKGKIKLG